MVDASDAVALVSQLVPVRRRHNSWSEAGEAEHLGDMRSRTWSGSWIGGMGPVVN